MLSDCLALHVQKRADNLHRLHTALKYFGGFSLGSGLSGSAVLGHRTCVRAGGQIVLISELKQAQFIFGSGPEICLPIPYGGFDLCIAIHRHPQQR